MKKLKNLQYISQTKAWFNNGLLALHFGLAFGLIIGTGILLRKSTSPNAESSRAYLQFSSANYNMASMEKVKEEARDKICFVFIFLDMVNP